MAIGDEEKYFIRQFTNLAGNYRCDNIRRNRLVLDNKFIWYTLFHWIWSFNYWDNFAYVGYQRACFKRKETGGGIVEFTEGQISYFGPKTGAIFSIEDIKCLSIDKSNSSSIWIIERTADYKVEIPTNVEGNEVLFDVFNSLEGFQIHQMLEALSSSRCNKTVLWQKYD